MSKGKIGAVGFKIITCEEQGATRALVVYGIWGGPAPKPLIEGGADRGIWEAYEKLLVATNAMIGDLRGQGKLKEIESFDKSVPVTAGGFYDPEPNYDRPQHESKETGHSPSVRLTPSAGGTPRGITAEDYFGRSSPGGPGLSPYSTRPYAPRALSLRSASSGLRAYSTPSEDK